MNCHFVTRSLTKRWEVNPGKLLYYDCKSNTIQEGLSASLFAQEDILSPEVEKWLSKHVEQPLGTLRNRAIQYHYEGKEVLLSRREEQAALIYFVIQLIRLDHAGQNELFSTAGRTMLEFLRAHGGSLGCDEFFDNLASANSLVWSVATLATHPGEFLYFPETGYFGLAIVDDGVGFESAIAVPITPRIALAMVSKAMTWSHSDHISTLLPIYSVSSTASRIVIPPQFSDPETQKRIPGDIARKREVIQKNGPIAAHGRAAWQEAMESSL